MKERARILVIDDSTTLRKLVEIAFRGTTAEIDFAASGAEAIRRATEHPPDVILLDFLLPDMRGVDVCARLAEGSNTAAVPVVVMSAKREGLREAFHPYPFVVDFVAKPFAMEEIRARLGAAMRGHSQRAYTQPSSAGSGVSFSGDLSAIPLLEALRFVSTLKLTGCLTLELSPRVEIYTREGDVVLATTHGPPAPADLEHVDLSRAPRPAIERASSDQSRTGKPAAATLAEDGYIPREVAPLAIHDAGARILASALDARFGVISWRSLDELPDYVEAFGRPQSVAGIALEQRRGTQAGEAVPAAFLSAIYQRTPRFSRKLAGARLSASERKLLALFDGETPVSTILERTGMSADKAASVCNRLSAVDLIELRDHMSTGSFTAIALWSAGDADFARALRGLLQRRAPPIELVDLGREGDLTAEILRARPRLILVAQPTSAQTEAMLEAVRASSSALVAVLDAPTRAQADACLAAGFHAVLAKPIHLNDLERLLSS